MKYYARFRANNGSTYNVEPYVFTNKQKAISAIRSIVWGNHFQQIGNTSFYEVTDEDGNTIVSGALHDHTMWWSREK